MANLLENKLEYTVKNVPDWFYKTLKKAPTIANDYVRVLPNVVHQARVKTLIAGDTISQVDARDCSWSPSQRITLDSKMLEVKNFKINEEQCLEDLDSVYSENIFNSIGANVTEYPTTPGESESLESVIMLHLQNMLANDIESLIWSDKAIDGVTDGIIADAVADSDTIKVTGTTLTSANIIDEVVKVYDSIPNNVLSMGFYEPEKAAVRIFMGISAYRFLKQALGKVSGEYQVVLPNFTYENGKIYYMGVEIVCIPALADNTMLAGSRDNLVVLTDLLADTSNIKVAQGADLRDENKIFYKGAYRFKASYIFSDEVVLYQV